MNEVDNDRPSIMAPMEAVVIEDWPFSFLNTDLLGLAVRVCVLQRGAVCCGVLYCVSVCCSVFQCAAVCCRVL